MGYQDKGRTGATLYSEVTDRIVAQIEEGTLPWVRPWDDGRAALGLPRNAGTDRRYSGINVLILWSRLFEEGYGSQRWLTYAQAQAMGGNVRKGERGTTVCYADRFTPKDGDNAPTGPDGEPRQIAFLKRFTVFNIEQCDGLGDRAMAAVTTWNEALTLPVAQTLIEATGADIRIGGGQAYYAPQDDYICVPRPEYFHEPINWFRTVLHELGHWSGSRSRLDRLPDTGFGSPAYAREELVAEMASAFLCAELGIVPTVRHADYLGAWLSVLREDSKAADYLLAFLPPSGSDDEAHDADPVGEGE